MASMEFSEQTQIQDTGEWGPTSEGTRETRTVIAADLVGYSELVFRDPHGGVRILRESRSILVRAIQDHGGAIVDTPGDFVLATFPDVAGATRAATLAQQQLYQKHFSASDAESGHWKIGIESGEVFLIDKDFYGTTINVAARLQALAGPGEIYLSDLVQKLGKFPPGFRVQEIGAKQLKNIERAVHIYRVYLPAYESLLVTRRVGLPNVSETFATTAETSC